MQCWYSLFLQRSARSIAWLAILVVFTISFLALIGWFLNIALLMSVRPQWISMSVITAACLILAGAQLVPLQVNPSGLRRFMVLQTPAVLVSLAGLLTMALYCFALVTGQDPSFGFAPFLSPFWVPENRLALLTAFNFLLSGIALALLANGSRRAANIAHILILPGAITSYLVLITYLLGVQAWHGLLDVPMALNTDLAFCALIVAIFCVRPDTWLMTVLTSDQAGGIMARRLLPALLLIPLLIGWLRLYGERSGAFVSGVGVALVAVVYTFCLLSLVLVTAASLNRANSKRRRVETALLESDVRFKAFMDNSPAIAWAKDEDGRYVYLSKACENRFGIRLERCRGKTDFDLWPQVIAEKFRKNDLEVLTSGQIIEVIEENVDPDGRRCYWWNFKFPFPDAAGERYVGGVGVDITERLRAEEALGESEERFRLAFENANIGMALVGTDGRYLRVNNALSRMFGYSREEMEKMGVRDLTYPDDLQLSKDFRMKTLRGETGNAQFEKRKVHRNGIIVWVHISSSLVSDSQGKPLYFISHVQDITARKRGEDALRRAGEELEQRVIERTEDLRLAVAQLQEEVTERQQAERALRESEQRLRYLTSQILTAQEKERKRLAMELHEGLGQSMTALKIYLRAIQRRLPSEAGGIEEDFYGARNLLGEMIEEVRHISRGLSPALLETLGFTAAIKHLLDEFGKYQEVTIKTDTDDIQNLFSPQTETNLFRVFQEAFNNITKHAQATQVSVTIKRQDGNVNFLIKDNGIGFDREQIAHAGIADKGMGLGAMDERLRMIGAHLNIVSQTGMGTEISFSIPIDAK
jgi:PAS domain S-box-containing protein